MKPGLAYLSVIVAIALGSSAGMQSAFADSPASSGAATLPSDSQPSNVLPVIALPNQPPTPGILGDPLGYRSKLTADGFTAAAAIYDDYSQNFHGGLSTSKNVNREFFDLDLTLTTDQAMRWHGGTFFLNFLDHQGLSGSTELVGDAQGFVNEDAPHSTQLYQFFYQQAFAANDQFRFKIGRVDATTDFAYVTNAASFLGSSFGYSPNILSFNTYPDPALAAELFWTPGDHFYLTLGVADANRTERLGILAGHPYLARSTANGVLIMEETGLKWSIGKDDLPGRFAVGAFYHTGTFEQFNDQRKDGAGGFYSVVDQSIVQLAKPDQNGMGGRNIGAFAQFALADPRVSVFYEHIGAGFSWTGPIPNAPRAADVLGVGAALVRFSERAGFLDDHELAIEAFYRLQLTPWFNIQPDLQYIVDPGGQGLRDALVATIRLELDF